MRHYLIHQEPIVLNTDPYTLYLVYDPSWSTLWILISLKQISLTLISTHYDYFIDACLFPTILEILGWHLQSSLRNRLMNSYKDTDVLPTIYWILSLIFISLVHLLFGDHEQLSNISKLFIVFRNPIVDPSNTRLWWRETNIYQ